MRNAAITFLVLLSSISYARQLKIAVVDTGIAPWARGVLCPSGSKDFTGEGLDDTNGHGTNISGIIDQYADRSDYCQIILKWYPSKNLPTAPVLLYMAEAIEEAVRQGADIINISGGGAGYNVREATIVKKALDSGITIVVAAGNDNELLSDDSCNYFPACYDKRIKVVGALTAKGQKLHMSNYGPRVPYWAIGEHVCGKNGSERNHLCESGTSQATAVVTGLLTHIHKLPN